MKKISFYILSLLCGFSVLSCDDKETPEEDKVMTEADQKSFIEDVAIDLAGKMPSKDFEEIRDFYYDLSGVVSDTSWIEVADSMMTSYFKCTKFIEEKDGIDTVISGYWRYDDNWNMYWIEDTSVVDVHFSLYEMALTLSNFTGHFTQTDTGWAYVKADDLQLVFKDVKEDDCVLKIAKEGKEAKMSMSYNESQDSERNPKTGKEEWYIEHTDLYLCVPEKVTLSLSKNGQNVIEVTVKYNINNLTEEGYFDLGKSNTTGGIEFALNNGYKLSFENQATANDKLSLSSSLSNASGELVSFTISGDPSGVPSMVLNEEFSIREFSNEVQNDDANIRNAYLSLSVDGALKMIGKVEDLRAFLEINDSINRNECNEEKYKAFVEEINKHLDLGIYYGNGKTKQASVQAEAYLKDKDEWRKEEYWNTRMVLVFSDGTRTSFDDFFDKDDFTKAIEAFEALEEEYETFINGGEE